MPTSKPHRPHPSLDDEKSGIRRECGNPEHHEYEGYLAVEDIDYTRTKTKRPQTNGICERFPKTVLTLGSRSLLGT